MDDRDLERMRTRETLVDTIVSMGYPEEFAELIAENLRFEKAMRRMTSYLKSAQPRSAEEIADEMLAICEEISRWRDKKETEYYNAKYNARLYEKDRFFQDGDDE